MVYPRGAEKDYDKRFFAPYRALIEEVPIFPVLGNHDVLHRNGAAFLDNFHLPSTATAVPSATTPSTGAEPTSSLSTVTLPGRPGG